MTNENAEFHAELLRFSGFVTVILAVGAAVGMGRVSGMPPKRKRWWTWRN